VVEGESVTFSADSGSLQVTQGVTDAAGTATADLRAGSNQIERTITVTARARGDSATIELPVEGNNLSLSGPDSVQSTGEGNFVARLTDSADAPIDEVELSASTDSGADVSPANANTDGEGRVTFTVQGTSGPTTDTLTVTGFNERASREYSLEGETLEVTSPTEGAELAVDTNHTITALREKDGNPVQNETVDFNVTRGKFPSGNSATTDTNGEAEVDIRSSDAGPVTVEAQSGDLSASREFRFVGVDPDAIVVTSEASEIPVEGETTISAEVADANGNAVADATVDFSLLQDPSNGGLSRASATTEADGTARTTFEAGPEESGKDGVEIEAQVRGSSPTIDDTTKLTVSGSAFSVTLGTGNELSQEDTTTYEMPWSVIVKNSSGQPAEGQEVALSVEGIDFIKGNWVETMDDTWASSPVIECPSEDLDNDNSLDDGEDRDGDGLLEPNLPGLSEGTLTTDAEGRASFRLIYPESEAAWARVRLQASVKNSTGTAFTDDVTFVLPAIADDVNSTDQAPPGGDTESRYGDVADCTDPD